MSITKQYVIASIFHSLRINVNEAKVIFISHCYLGGRGGEHILPRHMSACILPRSDKKNKKSTSKIRELFSLFKV